MSSLMDAGGDGASGETFLAQPTRKAAAPALLLELMAATCNNKPADIVTLLLEGANMEGRSSGGYTPLVFAARLGHAEVVKLLLDRGAYVDAATDVGDTALLLASKWGHADICSLLLDRGASLTVRNRAGFGPLLAAVSEEHAPVVEVLLKHGADANAVTCNGASALCMAAQKVRPGKFSSRQTV
eukprot:TRINITY_DN2082_c0_g1_i2.p1 TRINITY_DN2082_c0_g1~~TRINITY_DN2082_c0_g1_i2.p1  ORF type:complete len:185 (+),score=42.06 TRINITY_DN2082_c0_g1_i2:142-696(+)